LGTNNLLKDIPVEKVKDFESVFFTSLTQLHPTVLENLRNGKLDEADLKVLRDLAADLSSKSSK